MVRLLVLLVLVGSCSARPARLTNEEAQRLAWYVEDVAHGLERWPSELAYTDGSAALADLHTWAGAATAGGRRHDPPLLRSRRERWPVLAAAAAAGEVAIDRHGLLRTTRAVATGERRRLLERLVEQENLDRLTLDEILARRGRLEPASQRETHLRTWLRDARLHHAALAGARTWIPPSASTSPGAPTTSTSPSVPAPRRAP